MPAEPSPPAIEFRGISKGFGSVEANRQVSFAVEPGTIHALVGENGAGKSTLMSILSGLTMPDDGDIRLSGQPVRFRSAADARAAGIAMVHQHFLLVATMTVEDNLILNADPRLSLVRARAKIRGALSALAKDYDLYVDPTVVVGTLPIGLRQRVEVLKALSRGVRILILDEPTAVLTPGEADQLFAVLRRLKAQGTTILFISHKLGEVLALADQVTVMRAGAVVATVERAATDERALAALMIARPPVPLVAPPAQPGPTILAARGLTVTDRHGIARLDHVDLDLRAGEIVGVAGVAGNGQSELLAVLAGLTPCLGTLTWNGSPVPLRRRGQVLRRLGLAHIAEDRRRVGLLLKRPAWSSAILGREGERPQSRAGFLGYPDIRRRTRALMADWAIRPTDETLAAGRFSGGNQQKLVAAREIGCDPVVLLAGQPTAGVDLGATETIHQRLLALRDRGAAILLVSSDLDEIRALSDRILVMSRGRIQGELARGEADETRLGLMMAGIAPDTPGLAPASSS